MEFENTMVIHALEKEVERAAWDIWIAKYPDFTEETFISFSDFLSLQMKPNEVKVFKSDEEILDEMLKVVSQYESRKGGQ
ncbi:MAG: hypothetical protein JXR88_12560 [Clostridia bacterium]|nr:hypothetical protein [Clostridia bacterium]